MFFYSSYWMMWSRILSTNIKGGPYVEVDLTPIGLGRANPKEWEKVSRIWIRKHGTARTPGDKFVCELPTDIEDLMCKNISPEIVTKLLTEDILLQIDWIKYNHVYNGGAPLDKIHI